MSDAVSGQLNKQGYGGQLAGFLLNTCKIVIAWRVPTIKSVSGLSRNELYHRHPWGDTLPHYRRIFRTIGSTLSIYIAPAHLSGWCKSHARFSSPG